MTELSIAHVTMVTYDLAYMLWRHVFLLSIYEAKLALLAVTL